MQTIRHLVLLTAALWGPAQAEATSTLALDPQASTHLETLFDDGIGTDYVFFRTDSICGHKKGVAITKPATVDYEALLAATDEVRKIKKKNIRTDSAEGRILMTKARRKVLDACFKVYRTDGHCGVWKKISRRDGRAIPDITAKVKAEMSGK